MQDSSPSILQSRLCTLAELAAFKSVLSLSHCYLQIGAQALVFGLAVNRIATLNRVQYGRRCRCKLIEGAPHGRANLPLPSWQLC
jgi:hypothetical protein